MAPRPVRKRARAARSSRTSRRPPTRAPRRPRRTPGFVGRDGSPVLDHYGPKAAAAPAPSAPPAAPTTAALPRSEPMRTGGAPGPTPPPPKGLLSLDRPFDLDGFSQLLGETAIRIEVPKEELGEVLRRVTDFMGFGIYVYAVQVRPAPDEMLRRFVIELQRVDFSAEARDWVPFRDKGRSDSPFGPTADG